MSIAHLREEYRRERLDERDVDADPFIQFRRWFHQAREAEALEPNAMALATAAADGTPNCRMVLLKDLEDHGFVFYTDYRSHKGGELEANARATLCFWWGPLERQVRIGGSVERVSAADSAAYFGTRPHGSRLGAWTSVQSQVIASREALEARYAELLAQYPDGTDVPLPPHWGGFRVIPEWLEFWQGRQNRLHDRLRYRRALTGWVLERLSP